MNIVLSIPASVVCNREQCGLFAKSVAQLVGDLHHVTVVLGGPFELCEGPKEVANQLNGNSNLRDDTDLGAISIAANAGRRLSAELARSRTCGIFLYGSDAGICRVRKANNSGCQMGQVEICEMDPHWIHIICANGGVPILSSAILSTWGEYYMVDPEEQAAICAIHLCADLLLYVILGDGITDSGGTVLRWLAVEDIERVSTAQNDHRAVRRLKLCRQALENGVRRARMLPVSQLEHLAAFYCRKIEHGTEVIINHGEGGQYVLSRDTAEK